MIRSNNFELKAKDTWENILSFSEELSNCLLLLEAKSDTFQRRKYTRAYSLVLAPSEMSQLTKEAQFQHAQTDVILKDSLGLDEFNYFEKTIIIATQISYVIYLVAINLGDWGKF